MSNAARAGRIALVTALSLATPAWAHALDRQEPSLAEVSGELSAVSVIAFGLLPTAALGFSPAMTLRWPAVSLTFEPRVLVEVASGAPPGSALARMRRSTTLGAMSACRHEDALFACGVFQLGVLSASPREDAALETGTPLLVTFGARGGFDWRFSRSVHLRSFLELHGTLGRPLLTVGGAEAWRAPAGALIAGVGLTWPMAPARAPRAPHTAGRGAGAQAGAE
ncbi:hypothetical protein SOCEGT47_081920 [Sorangium cellulosum]|uniref:Secreted protein n=1 Tax=Sorangium cellulosum TaxID=56 RepID=A0A4P2QDX2_SORCE|nr:hypothetical protein [Sorangium cellulosum]AUX27596.1 hypothetical protein SOCEGT47_081920 [Sorangium cellulosum]